MMSSFASVFVANANATPEKVVPWFKSVRNQSSSWINIAHKVNTNDQLRLASPCTLNLGRRSVWSHILLRCMVWHIAALVSRGLLLSHLRSASISGVYCRRMLPILLARRHRARRSTSCGVCVAGGTAKLARLIVHGETRVRGRMAGLRCDTSRAWEIRLAVVR